MREVKPTQKPVPSSDIKDLFFNSGLLDIWATSLERKYIDRFGNCHLTAAGMEWLFKELVEKFKIDMNIAIVAAGYITIDSFQQGADLPNNELTQRNQIVRDENSGEYYRWDGDLPKQVPAGSTPQSAGGIGKGAWVSVGDASLRSEIYSNDGRKYIGKCKTIAELRSTDPDFDKQWIDVEKYHDDSDYPQGSYWFDASDSTTEDNGGTVIVTVGGKRWKFIGIPSVETYGAYGDGEHDDADAINKCANVEMSVNFNSDVYLLMKSIGFMYTNQEFNIGKATRLVRKLTALESTGAIIDYTIAWRESCTVNGGVFSAHPSSIGKVTGVYSVASIYMPVTTFNECVFERSLRYGINGNPVLCNWKNCKFGTSGAAAPQYQHVRAIGEDLSTVHLTANANTFDNCVFMHAKGVEYGVEFGDGYQVIFNSCDAEMNVVSKAAFKSHGMFIWQFNQCWFERNNGKALIECAMDTTGSIQAPISNAFNGCWIKLDKPDNECAVYSKTMSFNIAFNNCAGSGFANKVLFKIDGRPDNYMPSLVSFVGTRLVGFNVFSDDAAFFGELSSSLIHVRNNSGQKVGLVVASGNDVAIRSSNDISFDNMSGVPMSIIRRRSGSGTEFIGFSPDGRGYVMRVPNGGGSASWVAL